MKSDILIILIFVGGKKRFLGHSNTTLFRNFLGRMDLIGLSNLVHVGLGQSRKNELWGKSKMGFFFFPYFIRQRG